VLIETSRLRRHLRYDGEGSTACEWLTGALCGCAPSAAVFAMMVMAAPSGAAWFLVRLWVSRQPCNCHLTGAFSSTMPFSLIF
jgi:hypothetical protein